VSHFSVILNNPKQILIALLLLNSLNSNFFDSVSSSMFTDFSHSASAITARHLAFTYPATQRDILKSIEITCPQGKVTAIMGGSGCGKTTLLRLIGGLYLPSRGDLTVLGKNIAHVKGIDLLALRKRMGFLFQFGALFTDLTVFENVAFPLREHTTFSNEVIADLVHMKLQAVGLRGVAQLLPSQISGGMARRVALARAVALDPELVLYDEPFAGLDPVSLGITAQLIRRLNDALGATSVIVSHDVAETFSIADHVIVLSQGRVLATGSPDELRNNPDLELQQFLQGQADGPVKFHMPAPDYAQMLGVDA
jgi:phospholipid/cholesterol/gamma-HCH transport system ATP-binding protein